METQITVMRNYRSYPFLLEKGMKAGGFPTKLKTGRSMYWALEMDGEKVFLLLSSGDRSAALYLAMIKS